MPEEKRKKEETYDKISVWYKLHCIQTVELPVSFCWGCNNIPSVFDFTPRLLCTVQGRLCQSKTGSSSRGGALQWFQLGSHRLDYSAFSLFSLKQHALIWPGDKQGTTGDVHTQSKRRTWYKEGKEKRLMHAGRCSSMGNKRFLAMTAFKQDKDLLVVYLAFIENLLHPECCEPNGCMLSLSVRALYRHQIQHQHQLYY